MTRHETIDAITARLDQLSDDQLEAVDNLTVAADGSVYERLSDAEKHEIDVALDELESMIALRPPSVGSPS